MGNGTVLIKNNKKGIKKGKGERRNIEKPWRALC